MSGTGKQVNGTGRKRSNGSPLRRKPKSESTIGTGYDVEQNGIVNVHGSGTSDTSESGRAGDSEKDRSTIPIGSTDSGIPTDSSTDGNNPDSSGDVDTSGVASKSSDEPSGTDNRTMGRSTGRDGSSDGDSKREQREQRRQFRRELAERAAQQSTAETKQDSTGNQGLTITVTRDTPPAGTPEKTPRITQKAKYKEPPQTAVNTTASSIQDVYEVMDSVGQVVFGLMGREYPEGALLLDDEKAKKISRSLTQMNAALPELALQSQKYLAPTQLASTLLLDTFAKGMLLYGAWKMGQPPKIPNPISVGTTQPTAPTTDPVGPQGNYPFSKDGNKGIIH